MYECFLDIGFEADLDTSEDPDMYELAYEFCNEDPSTRDAAIAELREMIYERGACLPLRTDDEYLLRFLRASSYIVRRAHSRLVRYCNFRKQYPHLYQDVDMWGLAKLKDAYEGTMDDRPGHGRLSIMKLGSWDINEFPVEDLVRGGMLMAEVGCRSPRLQVMGTTVIVDLEGVTLRHVAQLTPTVAHQITNLMGLSVPGRLNSCHIVNYSWILNTFFFVFKRFIPQQAWNKIFFHGYNLKSLHEHIDPECLPPRYGGTSRSLTSFGTWLKKVKQYRDEKFDKDMKQLGYLVKE